MMAFIVYFYIYSGAAFFVLAVAICWGNDQKVTAASLLLASIILTNIFQQLEVLDAITPEMLNLIYALMDLFLLWVFIGIARNSAPYERNNWATMLAIIQFVMLSVNLFVNSHPSLTRAYAFMVALNGLMIAALVTCLVSFIPKSWHEAGGVLKVKWLYFKADVLDRLMRVLQPKDSDASSLATAFNAKIGGRIRNARVARAVELDDIGAFLGVGADKVEAYESGERRLSARALHALAKFLGTNTRFFIDGITVEATALRRTRAVGSQIE